MEWTNNPQGTTEFPRWSGPFNPIAAPSPRGGHTTVAIDQKIYVFGGSAFNKQTTLTKEFPLTIVSEDLYVYDTSNNTWTRVTTKGNPPSPRYAHSVTRVGKKLVFFGGFNGTRYLDDMYIFDSGT
jgi:N-acetylneuraminic acid mutarotase